MSFHLRTCWTTVPVNGHLTHAHLYAGEVAAKKLLAETGSAAACVPLSVVLTSPASIDKLVATIEQHYAQQVRAIERQITCCL